MRLCPSSWPLDSESNKQIMRVAKTQIPFSNQGTEADGCKRIRSKEKKDGGPLNLNRREIHERVAVGLFNHEVAFKEKTVKMLGRGQALFMCLGGQTQGDGRQSVGGVFHPNPSSSPLPTSPFPLSHTLAAYSSSNVVQ